jgi:hypothetical protein
MGTDHEATQYAVFHHSPVTTYPLGSNIFLSTPLPNILTLSVKCYFTRRYGCPHQTSSDRALVHKNRKRGEACPYTLYSFGADCVWNVMAHAQKPDFVFRWNGRVHLNRRGASVQSTTGSRGVGISGSNAGYTKFRGSVKRVLATHSIRQFPLHFPSRASPCAITFQLDSTNALPDNDLVVKGKLKFTLEQATKAQRGSRGIALLFL